MTVAMFVIAVAVAAVAVAVAVHLGRRLSEARRAVDAKQEQIEKLKTAVKERDDAKKALSTGSDTDRFNASIDLLQKLGG